jgi:SAM-dependent methyltransferase
VSFQVMDAQRLDFADGEFDAIYCQSAMHILVEYPGVSHELVRVLKPGGRLVFSDEPLGHNPLFEIIRARRRRRYRECGGRTIRYKDIRAFGAPFGATSVRHFNLFSQVRTLLGGAAHRRALRGPLRVLHRMDEWLLAHVPFLRPLAGKIVVEYVKEGGAG